MSGLEFALWGVALLAFGGLFFALWQKRQFDLTQAARQEVIVSLRDGVLVLDEAKRVVEINPAACELLGVTREQARGKQVQEALAFIPGLVETYLDIHEIQTVVELPGRAQTRFFDLQITPLTDSSGRSSGRVIRFFDISQQKRVEAELSTQKRIFENLVAMSRAASDRPTLEATLKNILEVSCQMTETNEGNILLLDGFGNCVHHLTLHDGAYREIAPELIQRMLASGLQHWVYRNRRSLRLDALVGDPRWEAVRELQPAARSGCVIPVIATGTVTGMITLLHPAEGHFTPLSVELMEAAADQIALALRNAQIFDQQRKLSQRQNTLYKVLRSISGQLDAHAIARQAVEAIVAETRLPAVAILLPDPKSDVLEIIGAAGALFAASTWKIPLQSGIVGRAFRMRHTQDVPDVSLDPDYIPANPHIRSELAIPIMSGKNILGILDIESEARDGFTAEDVVLLESIADVIALALENANLFSAAKAARDAAEAANIAKTEFVSTAAHELKAPMTSIKGYADLLTMGAVGQVNETQHHFLNVIKSNVDRMVTLVSDLADVSRIESGRLKLEIGPVSMREVMHELEAQFQQQVAQKKQTLDFVGGDKLPLVACDRVRLYQVMANLVSNAHKYSLEGGEIKIFTTLFEEAGRSWVQVGVRDTGLGIREEEKAKVFQKFFRSEDESAREMPGSGLGLNITRHLVELQGGRIWFESEYGKGSTFFFTVPVHV